jgi:transposase
VASRSFTQEYRDLAVSLPLDLGRSIAEVAKSIGVHEATSGKWGNKAVRRQRMPCVLAGGRAGCGRGW